MNFNKDNLITINKNEIKKNSKVIKIDDMYFLIGDAISSVKNIEYYKCVAVGSSVDKIESETDNNSSVSSTDIIVTNSGLSDGDGRYILEDADATGFDRAWVHGNYRIDWFTYDQWTFCGVENGYGYIQSGDSNNIQDPVNVQHWNNYIDENFNPVLEWASAESETPTVWSGKKLIWNTKIETIKSPDEIILNISGDLPDNYKGDYSLTDETKDKSGTDRIWKNGNGIYLGFLNDQWYLSNKIAESADDFYYYNFYPY